MDHDVELEAGAFRLRPLRARLHDVDVIVGAAADPSIAQWSRSLRMVASIQDGRSWIEERFARADTYEWLVEDDTGVVLGRVGLHPGGDDLEIGYWTLAAGRRLGVASAAARAVTAYAHRELARPRVGIVHAVANEASCRTALAASFPCEGTMRGALDHGDGRRWDAHLHARLAGDPWDPVPAP